MEEDYIAPELASAFNAGYTLQKHEPALIKTVLQSADKGHDYIHALASGKKQFERDKIIEQQQKIKAKNLQHKPKR